MDNTMHTTIADVMLLLCLFAVEDVIILPNG